MLAFISGNPLKHLHFPKWEKSNGVWTSIMLKQTFIRHFGVFSFIFRYMYLVIQVTYFHIQIVYFSSEGISLLILMILLFMHKKLIY